MSWVEFCDWLRNLPRNRELHTVWHPLPKQNYVRLLNGRVAAALKGEVAYQLEGGERIAL